MNIVNDMQLFVRVVNCDGLAAAGRELGMTPSSVTMRIKKLEKHYQVKLLARTTRSINLTDSGREFYNDSLRMLEDIEEIEFRLKSSNEKIRGPLRVTAPSDLGRQHIAPLLDRFVSVYPDVTPFLNLSDSVQDLTESSIDIAVRYGINPNSQLIAKKIMQGRRVLCASREYLEKYGMPESPQDLANHLCLAMVQVRTPMCKWYFDTEEGETSVVIKPSRSCDDGAQIRQWALGGAGIALKSFWDVAVDLKANRLVTVLDDFKPDYQSKKLSIGADLHIAYQNRNYVPNRISEFTKFVTAYFTEIQV